MRGSRIKGHLLLALLFQFCSILPASAAASLPGQCGAKLRDDPDSENPHLTRVDLEHAASVERGKKDFIHQMDFFTHPENYLNKPELTPAEREAFSKAAYDFLTKNGLNTPNANHIADHLAALNDPTVQAALKKAGINLDDARLLVLVHDLGKEYNNLPDDYKNFIANVFPVKIVNGRDSNLSNRVAMGHEIASMIMIDKIAAEQGISPNKAAKLKALISHHNAGYDPDLPGYNFWVKSWPDFAKKMNSAHADDSSWVPIPETYSALQSVTAGQDPRSINLTANDRATSYTLASQEKFATFLPSFNQWSNAGLAEQFSNNAKLVASQIKDIYSKFPEGKKGIKYQDLQSASNEFFLPHQERLQALSEALPQMAKGEGRFSDRPPLSDEEAKSSIVYKNTANEWFKVTAEGAIFRGTKGKWHPADDLLVSEQTSPATTLFRKVIYPDFDYEPESLGVPHSAHP